MPTNHDQTQKLSPKAEQLAELARAELGQLSLAQRSAGLRALNQRLERRRHPFYVAPKLAFAIVALVAAVAFVVGRFGLEASSGAPLSYEVDGGKPSGLGDVDSAQRAKTLRFSEGTEVTVSPATRARVRAVDDKGAQLSVEDGKLSLRVTSRPQAAWSVSAGPYLIRVTGTSFSTEWSATASRLDVCLEHGSVTVTGPLVDEPIGLRAGQQLTIRLPEREVMIRELAQARASDLPPPAPGRPNPADTANASPPAPETAAQVDTRPSAAAPSATPALKWSVELSSGRFDAILQDAKSQGIDHVLRTTSSDELAALADAARFRQQNALARLALTTQRERFAQSSRARDAAFLLGRLEEANGGRGQAVVWYDRYLVEAPSGTYASEALGRKMVVMETLEGKARAREIAKEYLRRFPTGAYAKAANALEQTR